MPARYTIAFFIVGLLLLAGGCSDSKESGNLKTPERKVEEPLDSMVIVLTGQEGKSVLEITKEQHEIDYLESAVGAFVNAIDSFEIGSKYGWMYSVNDAMGQVASDKYITHDSDIIKWHYRKF